MKFIKIIILLFSLVSCTTKQFVFEGQKNNGASFVAPVNPIDSTEFTTLKQANFNAISVMPYAFLRKETGEFMFDDGTPQNQKQWWGEKPDGVRKTIQLARSQGIKTMLKPHFWIGRGEFTGDLNFESVEEWIKLESGFRKYILLYAQIAEEEKVDIFCIGTELKTFIKNRKDFWESLILDVKKIYKGKLTYAENWDCYDDVWFIDKLDFIGVDAYFPLAKNNEPTENELVASWKNWNEDLQKLSNKHQKPILFTEFGYQAIDGSLIIPWETNMRVEAVEDEQKLAYEVFFKETYKQPYLAGVFIWKWFVKDSRELKFDKYTPQGRQSLEILKKNFN